MKEQLINKCSRKELECMCLHLGISKVGSREKLTTCLLAFPYAKLKDSLFGTANRK